MVMDFSRVKYSGGKLVAHSALRAAAARGKSMTKKYNNNKDIRVATWNVRSVYNLAALRIITSEANKYSLDLIAIQETKLPGEGQSRFENYTFFYGGNNSSMLGTGFLVKNNIISAIKDFQFVNDRMSFIILHAPCYKYVLINVHCPTEDKDDEIKDNFYDELDRLFDQFSNYDVKIILGDFNAKIGKEEAFRPTVGLESLHDKSNDNGIRAVNFATSKNLIVKSTYFKHKDIHKATWTSFNGKVKNQIDHFLIDKRHHTNIVDVRVFRGADCNSDHFLVVAKIRTRLAVNTLKSKTSKVDRFDVEQLKDTTGRIKYQVEISNRFQVLLNTSDSSDNDREPETIWKNIKNIVEKSAKATIGLKKRDTRKKPWFDEECEELVKKRREARIRSLNSNVVEKARKTYDKIRKDVTKVFRLKKREWEKQKVLGIKNNFRINNIRGAYRGVNSIRKGYQSKSTVIRNENGQLVADTTDILNTWKKYFNKLLNVHDGQVEIDYAEVHTDELHIENPDFREVEAAMRKLKNNKSPGIDQLPSELFKYGGRGLTRRIHELIGAIWDFEKIPNEWKEAIIIPIFKKGDKTNCNNYRGISLLPACYKILTNVVLNKLTPYAEKILGDYQCGFRRNRSTTDQLFTIRQILEKKWEYCEVVHQLFIDFKKAYDSVKRSKMYEILVLLGIPKKLVRIIQICLNGHQGRVRVGNNLSDPFEIRDGLKQGDALSPILFNLVLEFVARRVQLSNGGLSFNGLTQILAYADDLDITGDSKEIIVKNTELLLEAASDVGLAVSEDKTEYMVTDRLGQNNDMQPLKVGNMTFKKVNEFKYLGAIINKQNEMKEELKKRIHAGNACFFAVSSLLKSQNLSKNVKLRIYKTIILPIVLYGCETWSLTKTEENRFRVFENKVLRKIFGAKKDEITGEYRILHNIELENLYSSPSIIRVIKSRRLRWAGHVARMENDRTAFRVLIGKPQSKRPLGRPRRRWEDNVKLDLKEIGYEQENWVELAKNREKWRLCVDKVMNFRVPSAIP